MNTLHPDLERFRAELRDAIGNDLDRRRTRHRARRRLVRIGLPGLAGALGLSLALVFAGTQAAFAGWSSSPTPASSGQTTSADATCQAQLAAVPPTSAGASAGREWSVVTTDVRGPFTLVIYQSASGSATCLIGPSVTVVSQNTSSGGSESVSGGVRSSGHGRQANAIGRSSMLISSGAGTVKNMTITHLASTNEGPFTVVEGQVADGVTGVTLVLGDGKHVQASTANGSFLAWWPGTQNSSSAEITSANGVMTQTLTIQPLAPPPPLGDGTCHADSQTDSSGIVCSGGSATPVLRKTPRRPSGAKRTSQH
jgi:hypothetical protein